MRYYIITYNKRPLGESGESCSTNYDLSKACIDCGTGATLSGNLRAKGLSNINKEFFETIDGDFLISQNIYGLLRKNFKDFKLTRVIDSQNNYIDYYHFISTITLPKFNNNSIGFVIEEQCQTCKRNGYFSDAKIGDIKKNIPTVVHPYVLRYKYNNFEKYKDEPILNTWECLGISNRGPSNKSNIRYARPLLIVNEKIKDIFNREKLSGILYEQIIIE